MRTGDQDNGFKILLTLFVAGQSPRSARARNNLEQVLEVHDLRQQNIEIVDVLTTPERAKQDRVFALPTLKVTTADGDRFANKALDDPESLDHWLSWVLSHGPYSPSSGDV